MRRISLFLVVWMLVGFASQASAGKKLKYNDTEKEFLHKVDLIITFEERKIFRKRLTTHHDRARFIELFWAKRDPDLTDNVNPFRKEWMARYDYIITHFKSERFRQNTFTKADLFLMLGPPSEKSHMIDVTLTGLGYRNAFTRYPPELWVYNDVGYDYKRRKLKVQFIPTSSFGEYVALTDRLSDHFLRNLKYRFIEHPDLEEPPLNAISSSDYQVVDLAGEGGTVVRDEPEEFEEVDEIEEIDEAAMPQAPPPVAENTPDTVLLSTPPVIEQTEEPEDIESEPQVAPQPKVEIAREERMPTMPPPAMDRPEPVNREVVREPLPAPVETDLTVPTKISDTEALTATTAYQPEAGNPLDVRARTGYFKSGTDRRLLLGRVGFPLNSLDFHFERKQYAAPFQLDYHLIGRSGKAVHGDSLRTEILLPNKRVLEKRTTWFSKEFAVIVSGDRYTLKAQLTDLNTGKVSYFETPIEVPPLREEPHATELVLMDPNVNPEFAKFNIRGRPYNIKLTNDIQSGDKLFPVTELVNVSKEAAIKTIEIQAIDAGGEIVHTWDLYSGEITDTKNNSFLIHPVLSTKSLEKGNYTLRLEIEMAGGEYLITEASFSIE